MLIQENISKSVTGTSSLSLTANANQSIRVKDIRYYFQAAGSEDIKLTVGRKTVFQSKVPSGWWLLAESPVLQTPSIANKVREYGMFPVIPVASGETFTATAPGSNNALEIVYDIYSATDVSNVEPNGSNSNTFDLWQVISNSAASSGAGSVALDQSDLDAVFPQFPGGANVPDGSSIQFNGMFGSPVSKIASSSLADITTDIKAQRNRVNMFSESGDGFSYTPDTTNTTNGTNYDAEYSRLIVPAANTPASVVMFDSPITFQPGDEVNFYAVVANEGGTGTLSAGDIKLGLFFRVTR